MTTSAKTSSLGGSAQLSSENISGTEDCLYLDILAPKIRSNSLPVMFWIHGGEISGLKDLCDFDKMASKHQVVIVK